MALSADQVADLRELLERVKGIEPSLSAWELASVSVSAEVSISRRWLGWSGFPAAPRSSPQLRARSGHSHEAALGRSVGTQVTADAVEYDRSSRVSMPYG
jgi:hypothetical protein